MNDLFRFLLLRPSMAAKPDEVKLLRPSFTDAKASRRVAKEDATAYLAKQGVLGVEDLAYGKAAAAARQTLAAGPRPLADLVKAVEAASGEKIEQTVGAPRFDDDEQRLADALVATKLLSDSMRCDAPELAQYAQGCDAIRRAAAGTDPIGLRPLTYDLMSARREVERGEESERESHEKAPDRPDRGPDLRAMDASLHAFSRLRANAFATPSAPEPDSRLDEVVGRLAALEREGKKAGRQPRVARFSSAGTARPWMLSREAVAGLPSQVQDTLRELDIDPLAQPMPTVLAELHRHRNAALDTPAAGEITVSLSKIGTSFQSIEGDKYVGSPSSPMPSGHGNIRPVGIGDLLLVKQHVLRYEGGDLAHVENVMKTEHFDRHTRRLNRTETTVVIESETTKEETRDTQTTDRFSLKRETSDTIKTDTQFKAGVSVDAKYGPMVEVKANADFSTQVATESATKEASDFSKDVVARSVSKIVERVLERRTTTTIEEFEESYSHGFDNTAGAGHVSGMYQWIDKVLQAQVYNYGKRMLFDVTLPEPATEYILLQAKMADQSIGSIEKPLPFTLAANQITESNYRIYAQRYGVSGIEPPPPFTKTVSKAYDGAVPQGPHESSKSDLIAIDDGYVAKYTLFQRNAMGWPTPDEHWKFLIGSNLIDPFGSTTGYVDMSGETGSVPIAYEAYQVEMLAATVEIFCERTERAVQAWQIKTHGAILAGYQQKQQAYESALAQARAAAGVVIQGKNPLFNQRVIGNELRKQCLTMLTAQQFDAFGALELSTEGYAQPNLNRATEQMPYVRFFEQAFEWEHIIYFFYPYFWGWKKGWDQRMLLDDVDPLFADFLRAGAGRVVFPVRPGFEAAVLHYLETGEIWNGGPPPDLTSPMYVSIIKEIQEATGAPGDEVPVGDRWEVHLPTTLVRLRPNDDLPVWAKVNEAWVPQN
jgi:hypothetical protein